MIPCEPPPACVTATTPLLGYQSEATDTQAFIAMGFGPTTPPPLDWTFDNPTCMAIGDSTVSFAQAQANAQLAAVACAESGWTNPQGQQFLPPFAPEPHEPPPTQSPQEPFFVVLPQEIFFGTVGESDTAPLT